MLGTALIVILIFAAGTRAADNVRVRQQEIILTKLPTGEAAAYYQLLKRRSRIVRILRGVSLLSLVAILYARNHAWQRNRSHVPGPSPGGLSAPPTGIGPAFER